MGAGGLDERSKGPSFDMAVAPEIDSSTITVVVDELTGDRGKVVVVGSGEIRGERAARRETLKAHRSLRIENAEWRQTRDP